MKAEVKKVLGLVAEMHEEEKKTVRVPHYYKRNGKMVRRSYDDEVKTERYKELFHGSAIRGEKVFCCEACKEKVDYFSLETWCCDFEKGKYICSDCYESEMGEDL